MNKKLYKRVLYVEIVDMGELYKFVSSRLIIRVVAVKYISGFEVGGTGNVRIMLLGAHDLRRGPPNFPRGRPGLFFKLPIDNDERQVLQKSEIRIGQHQSLSHDRRRPINIYNYEDSSNRITSHPNHSIPQASNHSLPHSLQPSSHLIPKQLTTPPTPLDIKLPLRLPQIILKAKKRALAPNKHLNTLNRDPLLLNPRTRRTIRIALTRPPGLQIIRLQPGTNAFQQRQFPCHERARTGSFHIRIEERMDIRRRGIKHRTQYTRLLLQDINRLGRRDRALIPRCLERSLALGDESREFARAAVAIEDGLIADNHHLHMLPIAARVRCDFLDLGFRGRDAGVGDEDAEKEFQAVRAGGGADVFEAGAVGAVEPDGAESFGGDGGDVGGYGGGGFAVARGGVG